MLRQGYTQYVSQGDWGAIVSARVRAEPFFVVEEDGRVLGFGGLRVAGDEAELTNPFVEPDAIGRGSGRRLWCHAVALAWAVGARRVRIESSSGIRRPGVAAEAASPMRSAPSMAGRDRGVTGAWV